MKTYAFDIWLALLGGKCRLLQKVWTAMESVESMDCFRTGSPLLASIMAHLPSSHVSPPNPTITTTMMITMKVALMMTI